MQGAGGSARAGLALGKQSAEQRRTVSMSGLWVLQSICADTLQDTVNSAKQPKPPLLSGDTLHTST